MNKVRIPLQNKDLINDPYNHDESFLEFSSWDEVHAFIDELKNKATKEFGKDYSNPVYDE